MYQLLPLATRPIAGHHHKEPGPTSLTSPFQQININKIPSRTSLLEAQQAQLPHPFKRDAPVPGSAL